MTDQIVLPELDTPELSIMHGVITAVDGRCFIVEIQNGREELHVVASALITSDSPVRFRLGDSVLCWLGKDDREHALILGRINSPTSVHEESSSGAATPSDNVPDSMILEAKHSLTLRVGDGSITIREDGKILIKGKDLVSHAQRLNRIKGGAVQIN